MEPAGGEKKEAWRNLLKGLLDSGLRGVWLVISDEHKSIPQALGYELTGVLWQRYVVQFERDILAHVSLEKIREVSEDLREIFQVKRYRFWFKNLLSGIENIFLKQLIFLSEEYLRL